MYLAFMQIKKRNKTKHCFPINCFFFMRNIYLLLGFYPIMNVICSETKQRKFALKKWQSAHWFFFEKKKTAPTSKNLCILST